MTIRVRITNEEAPGGRNVEVLEMEPRGGDRESMKAPTGSRRIAPQESAEFYVHLLKDLTVREQHPDLHG